MGFPGGLAYSYAANSVFIGLFFHVADAGRNEIANKLRHS